MNIDGVNECLQTPLPSLELSQHLTRTLAALSPRADHVVRGDANACLVVGRELFLGLAREPHDLAVGKVRPQLELARPLVHGDGGGAQAQDGFAHASRRGDARERFPRAAR